MSMKVANVFRYVIGANGKPNKDHKSLIREKVLLEEDYIKKMNKATSQNGLEAKVLTKETEQYYKECEKINEERKEKAEERSLAAQLGLSDRIQKRARKSTPENKEDKK